MSDKILDRLREYGWHEDYRVAEIATEAAAYIDALEAELVSLKGQKKGLVIQNAMLRQRPDLPVDRLPIYKELTDYIDKLEEQRDELEAVVKKVAEAHFDLSLHKQHDTLTYLKKAAVYALAKMSADASLNSDGEKP